ncbi:glycoside hydrolase family 43 protein [Marinilongibacter aquaticus]|uniref:glycoside hydrolase family 43 protein n=1 Tax=Marinilongibacter aquaticus TaxID=2975157 RepID=UPI0021BD5ECD|nr:glycoside hydrolase family 43 protein [Marinilongibacter aquaticus]UBM60836.1 glycoside hydrolase family 43 protein [Marinilongibacter aquaticus]
MKSTLFPLGLALATFTLACHSAEQTEEKKTEGESPEPISQPLVSEIYTADPSAHVFEGKIYVYPSHDIDVGIPDDDLGSQYAMKDYRVLSMDKPGGEVQVHGVALDIADVPWAGRQMWAPDAAEKDGKYYLYFPAKDKEDIFHIGVAVGDKPEGPFVAEPEPIPGSISMDPAVFQDDDGSYYMYFGGIWGGQLQYWSTGELVKTEEQPADNEPGLLPKVAQLNADMKTFVQAPKDLQIWDENGAVILSGNHDKRFFEASWMHKYEGKYYFSYSTGDTHKIVYAVGDNPFGPFTYKGVVLNPVQGWTNHHSIVEFEGQWYLFYHDTQLSGKNHLRNVKMTPLRHLDDGSIETITAYK